jgi:ATP-dependent DNA helicase Q4
LPALLTDPGSIVLVISPLLSLVQDQIDKLPRFLTGATISSQQTPKQTNRILKDIREHKVKVLFVSPEKISSEHFQRIVPTLPPIAFVCIDEAHCVSEWSHNFRTSYLRLNAVLRQKLNVKCILALTATATKRTEEDICKLLSIPTEAVIRVPVIRKNLKLSCSTDSDKFKALVALLKTPRFSSLKSMIIYCMFQVRKRKKFQQRIDLPFFFAQFALENSGHFGELLEQFDV